MEEVTIFKSNEGCYFFTENNQEGPLSFEYPSQNNI